MAQAAINVGDTVNIRFCIGQAPTTAQVTAVDPIRRLVSVTHLTGPLVGKPSTAIHMDHVRQPTEPQYPLPNGTAWA
jgi:hypothetical protein